MNKQLELRYGLLAVGALVTGVALALFIDLSMAYGIGLGVVGAVMGALQLRSDPRLLVQTILRDLKRVLPVLFTMTLIGMLVPIWMHTGTLASLMHFGLEYLLFDNLLLAAFVFCTFISMLLGTGIGTLSTAGLVFMGIGALAGIPPAAMTGAILSGAYLGDRSSPMSSSALLIAAMTETNLMDNVKEMMRTGLPAFVLTCLAFFALGSYVYPAVGFDPVAVDSTKDLLSSKWTLSPWTYLSPAILLLVVVGLRKPIWMAMGGSILVSFLVGWSSGLSPFDMVQSTITGYSAPQADMASLMGGSGALSMLTVNIVISLSAILNSILKSTGMLSALVDPLVGRPTTSRQLFWRSGLLSFVVTLVACNQSMAALVSGDRFKDLFRDKGLPANYLARMIADTGIVVVALIPWNVNGLVASAIMGVPTVTYLPFTIFCWLTPLVALVFTGLWRHPLTKVAPSVSKSS